MISVQPILCVINLPENTSFIKRRLYLSVYWWLIIHDRHCKSHYGYTYIRHEYPWIVLQFTIKKLKEWSSAEILLDQASLRHDKHKLLTMSDVLGLLRRQN